MKKNYEEVFDIDILNIEIPTELRNFMELHGLSLKYELPQSFQPGLKKIGLCKSSLRSSEMYLYLSQISQRAAEVNTCHVGIAFGLLNNPEKLPKTWNKQILIFETIFVDKEGLESFMYLDTYYGKKRLGFCFVAEGFITPPERSRFVCFVD